MSMMVGKGFAGSSWNNIDKSYSRAKPKNESEIGKKPDAAVFKNNDISSKNENNLSEKAQNFLKELREKYSDYDLMVGNGEDELKTLSKSGSKEFSVIFSNDELERMANDEKYAEEKMRGVEGAIKMSIRICEENGYLRAGEDGSDQKGRINKISVTINDDGSMKIFAELEKLSDKQKERIEKSKEARAEEKKANEKKLNGRKSAKNNPYEKDDRASVKRTTIEASSEEELLEKLNNIDWEKIGESYSGDKFNFTA